MKLLPTERTNSKPAVRLPPPAPGLVSSYRKIRTRRAWDFALTGVALAVRFDGSRVESSRIFLSGVAPVPWRARKAEAAIEGRTLDDDTVKGAAAAAVEGATPLSGNGYKVPLVRGAVEEELIAIRR